MSFRELCQSVFLTQKQNLHKPEKTKELISGIAFSSVQNGEVFLFTGMLSTVVDLHQLAVIIGHEMAHAVLGHSVSASLSAGLCCVFSQQYQDYANALRQHPGNESVASKRVPTVDVCQQSLDWCQHVEGHIVQERIHRKAFF